MCAQTADLIIIGAGSAGIELARIASRSGQSVFLFEQGSGNGRHIFQKIPLMVGKAIGDKRFTTALQTIPQMGLNNRCLPMLMGRGLGGSSQINGNVAYVGPYQRYQQVFQPLGLDFKDELESISQSFDIEIERNHTWSDPLSNRFLNALETLGNPYTKDPDTEGAFSGASLLHVNTKHGYRFNHLDGYFSNAAHHKIKIIRSQKIEIGFKKQTASFVRCQTISGNDIFYASEIIICAGSIFSPSLLMEIGIGDAKTLKKSGLSVWHDLPMVGKNLKDHANLRLPFSCPMFDTLNQKTRGIKVIYEGLKFITRQKNTVFRGPGASAGINLATDDDIMKNALRIQLVHFTQNRGSIGKKGIVFETAQKASLGIYNLWPKSTGTIRLTTMGIQIDPGFMVVQDDLDITLHGLKIARSIIHKMGFHADENTNSDIEIIKNGVYSGYHLIGSNRMSIDETKGVVDPNFRVHGISNLSICDASIFPDHLSSHSYLPTIAIARKFANLRGWHN